MWQLVYGTGNEYFQVGGLQNVHLSTNRPEMVCARKLCGINDVGMHSAAIPSPVVVAALMLLLSTHQLALCVIGLPEGDEVQARRHILLKEWRYPATQLKNIELTADCPNPLLLGRLCPLLHVVSMYSLQSRSWCGAYCTPSGVW